MATEMLAAAGQAWRAVPAPEGVVLLRRVDGTGPAPARTSFSGHVEHQGEIADVLNLISTSRWTGGFDIFGPRAHKKVYFENGDVRGASSSAPEDRLGEILVREGAMTRGDLEAALAEVPPGGRLGAFLVRRGTITSHDLYAHIIKQIEQVFFSLLLVGQADFVFVRQPLPEGLPPHTQLSTQNLLLEGLQRIDEMSYFREKIPTNGVVFEAAEACGDLADLSSTERQLLLTLDGETDLARAASIARLGEFDATKAAFRLLQTGRIKPGSSRGIGRAHAARQNGPAGVVAVFNEVFSRIAAEARAQGRGKELATALSSFFEAATDYSELFRAVTLSADGTLAPEVLVENALAAHVPDPTDFVYQGLNEFLFFTMFVAGETLDQDTEIELQRRLDQVLGREGGAP